MKLRFLRFCSLIAIHLFLLNPALAASTSILSNDIESFSQAPSAEAQTSQNHHTWGANLLSSVFAPDTILIADAAGSDASHASCANNDGGSNGVRNQRLRIRNGESCAADGGIMNWLKLPGWATPWKTKKKEAAVEVESDDYESCLGVVTPVGMALPYHLCCLGIVNAYVNGLADQISRCSFDFSQCKMIREDFAGYRLHNHDVCCQTFYLELGSKFATGINCLPRT
ncbi:hypothetical protein MMC31_007732 [Peltigera leucophlebia]|nr:hypothetical protein [Peltigera leucophlebia]